MKRIVLEFPYEGFWRMIFGPNLDRVEILEALRCFRCDLHGFAIICRIKLREQGMMERDLVGQGGVKKLETLYREKDGSLVVFVAGSFRGQVPKVQARRPKILAAGPPEFLDVNRMKVALVGEGKQLQKYLDYVEKLKFPHRILQITSVEPRSGTLLSRLTTKQKRAILTGFGLGYYDVPRRVSSEEVARHLKVSKSTLVEEIRRGERTLLAGILSE